MTLERVYNYLLLTAVGTTSIAAHAAEKPKSKKPMNIIFIMSDDHTAQSIGAYKSRLAVLNPTPVLDEFASDALLFENTFCTNSISTPSRAVTVTGQYAHHNDVRILPLHERDYPKEDQQYLIKEFNNLGYQTAIIGKWHLQCEPSEFDYYSVFIDAGGQGKYFDPKFATNQIKDKKYPNNTIQRMGHSTDAVTDLTLEWLEKGRDSEKPFFLMHHYKAPHDMFEYAPRYEDFLKDVDIPLPETMLNREGFGSVGTRGENGEFDHIYGTSVSARNKYFNYANKFKYKSGDFNKDAIDAYNHYLKMYLRCAKGIDDNLARLFKYLKDNDLWENTIILYSGDQGMMLGEHDLIDKRWGYEESMRMPLIVRVPGSKANGKRNDMIISNVDFAPTLLSLAGKKETPEYMDGDNFSKVFETGKDIKNWKTAHYYRYWMHLVHHNVPAHFGIRTKDYKLLFFYGQHYDTAEIGTQAMYWYKDDRSIKVEATTPSFELYDLKNDPHETTNVADDPHYAKVLAKLKKQLLELKTKVGDDDSQFPHIQRIIDENF